MQVDHSLNVRQDESVAAGASRGAACTFKGACRGLPGLPYQRRHARPDRVRTGIRGAALGRAASATAGNRQPLSCSSNAHIGDQHSFSTGDRGGSAMTRPEYSSPFGRIEDAIVAMRAGKMVIVVDDEDRENEGDLTIAAEKVTPDVINFMAQHARGLICLAITGERLDELDVPLMVVRNESRFETAFCVSIEAREHTTTGISAADRATTILAAIDPATKPSDLTRPGHIFPLRAKKAGVLQRAGQTEAAVDLASLAGLRPAGVICEIMSEDGTMARVPELSEF